MTFREKLFEDGYPDPESFFVSYKRYVEEIESKISAPYKITSTGRIYNTELDISQKCFHIPYGKGYLSEYLESKDNFISYESKFYISVKASLGYIDTIESIIINELSKTHKYREIEYIFNALNEDTLKSYIGRQFYKMEHPVWNMQDSMQHDIEFGFDLSNYKLSEKTIREMKEMDENSKRIKKEYNV